MNKSYHLVSESISKEKEKLSLTTFLLYKN